MAESQTVTRQAAGLYTQFSPLTAPQGAQEKADNAVIDREGMISNRRGFANYGFGLSTLPVGLFEYRRKLVVLDGTKLKYDATGLGSDDYTVWGGDYSFAVGDVRMHALEVNNSFYFTTVIGVYKADAPPPGTPRQAGMPEGLDSSFALSNTSGFAWLQDTKFTSYRTAWTRLDANGILVVGAPSQQYWVENSAGGDRYVVVTSTVPAGVVAGDILEVYRTDQAASAAELGDRHYLAGRVTYASGTTIDFTDHTDDGDLGDELYTSPFQETISQANHRPPFAKFMAQYKGHVFYANIRREQFVEIRMIDVDAFAVGTSQIILNVGGTTRTYTAGSSEDIAAHVFKVFTGGLEAIDIRNTSLSLERVINRDTGNTLWDARYTSGLEGLPGILEIRARSVAAGVFTVNGEGTATKNSFEPALSAVSKPLVDASAKLARSKFGIPEAVPASNTRDIGRPGFAILGMAALKNVLLIFKEDGIYSLSGETDGGGGFQFIVDELDPTIRLLCPDSLATLDNAVFGMTTQGVVRVFEGGSAIVSHPIERDLKILSYFPEFSWATHAFADEGEHKYHLWTQEVSGQTFTPIDWVYDYLTNAWVRWRKDVTCGIVLSSDRRIYLGHSTQHIVLRERKDFLATDHRDEYLAFHVTAKTTTSYLGATRALVTGTYAYKLSYQDLIPGWTFHYAAITSRILSSVNTTGTTYQLILEDNPALTVGGGLDALVAMPIFLDIIWMAEDGGNAGSMKQFSQVQYYRLPGTTFNYGLSFLADTQDTYAATTGLGLAANDPVLRSEVPGEHQGCRTIRNRLQHAVAGEKVDILQLTWDLRPYGSRT